MLTNEMPVIGGNALNNVFGVVDTVAQNPVGSLWTIPALSVAGGLSLVSTTGYGSFLTVKYLQYKGTANTSTVQNGPAPVYYTDETFSTISGHYADSVALDAGIAGWMLPNSGSTSGVGLGSAFTSAVLLNGGLGTYVFVAVEGFVPKARLAAGAQGNAVTGASGDWTVAITTTVLRPCGYIWGSVTSNIGDIIATVGMY